MSKKLSFLVFLSSLIVIILMKGCAPEYEVEVQADPEDAGEISGKGTYNEGEKVTVEAEPEEGYELLGWKVDGDKVSEDKNYEFEIHDDKQLEAVFEKKHAIETEGIELEKLSRLPGGLAPKKPFIEASLEENFLLFRIAVGTGPYNLVDLQKYKDSDVDAMEPEHSALDILAEETITEPDFQYDSLPKILPDEKIAYSYASSQKEQSFIDIGGLQVPFKVEHQIELKDQEYARGIKPFWKSEKEIYYITPNGVMSYSLSEEKSKKVISSSDLNGLVTSKEIKDEVRDEKREFKEMAPHDFNLRGNSNQLAYFYEDKLKIVSLEDKSQKEIFEIGLLGEEEEEKIEGRRKFEFPDLEFLFDGEYVVVEEHFIEVESGEVKELASEGEYLAHAWNGEDELLAMFEKEYEELGYQIELQTYDANLHKQNEAFINVISGSGGSRANVTYIDDTWGILLPGESGFNLYEAYFD